MSNIAYLICLKDTFGKKNKNTNIKKLQTPIIFFSQKIKKNIIKQRNKNLKFNKRKKENVKQIVVIWILPNLKIED